MSEFISRSKIYIDYSRGNYQLKAVKSFGSKHDGDTEGVLAIGVRGGAGFRDKEGAGSIDLDVYREKTPEVDYRGLHDRKEIFSITVQDEDGVREQYRSCRVAAVPERKISEQGETMDTVKIIFLQSSKTAG